MEEDIIAAIATSRLEAAISIIRVSGKGSIAFVQNFFTTSIIDQPTRTIHYGYIKDAHHFYCIFYFTVLTKSTNYSIQCDFCLQISEILQLIHLFLIHKKEKFHVPLLNLLQYIRLIYF